MANISESKKTKRFISYFALPLLLILLLCIFFLEEIRNKFNPVSRTLGEKPWRCLLNSGAEISRIPASNDHFGSIDLVTVNSCGRRVFFYEAIPRSLSDKAAVVLALHQTTNSGKNEVMGLGGDLNLSHGKSFYERGHIVIAPDIFLAGQSYNDQIAWSTERFYQEFPDWSAMGVMLEDHMAVSRYAEKFKDRCKVAVGHSLGGHNALFLGAFNKNINVVISNGGFSSIASDVKANRWSRDSGFIYIPLLKPYVKALPPKELPWDFDDVLKLINPRPALIIHGKNDGEWPNNNSVPELVAKANDGSAEPGISLIFHEGGHYFGLEQQMAAIEFAEQSCEKTYN